MSTSRVQPIALGGQMVLAAPPAVVTVAGTTLTVSNLNLDTDGPYFIETNLLNNTGTLASFQCFVNGDVTATNYYRQGTTNDSTSLGVARVNDAVSGLVSASASSTGFFNMQKSRSGHPIIQGRSSYGTGPSTIAFFDVTQVRNNTANVTSLSLVCSQNLAVGSWVKVYKVANSAAQVQTAWASEATTITATTTNPTKGTIVADKIYWRRIGDSMVCRIDYQQSSVGTVGSGNYLFTIPNGKTIDTTKCRLSTANSVAAVGMGVQSDLVTYTRAISVHPYNTTKVSIGDQVAGLMSHGNMSLGAAQASLACTFTVPILEWA